MEEMDLLPLIRALDGCLARYLQTGDADILFAPAAEAQARELADRAAVADSDDELEIAYPLAMFHHYRVIEAAARGEHDPGSADSAAALRYFHTLYSIAPDLLPDGLLDGFEKLWPVTVELLRAWGSRAGQVSRQARAAHDLDVAGDAVRLFEHIVRHTAIDPEGLGWHLSGLGLARRVRFLLSGQADDIKAALDAGHQAVDAAEDDGMRRAFRSNLAVTYIVLFEHNGDPATLNTAISQFRAAVDDAADADLVPGRASNLASSLATRYTITGARADLDEAIDLFARAVRVAREPAERAEYLSNMSAARHLRFGLTGDTTDLDLSVDAARTAVAEAADDPVTVPSMVNNLGLVLRARFQRTGHEPDIDDAVTALRDAAQSCLNPREQARCLSNLSSALRVRFDAASRPDDIDDAVRQAEAAVRLATEVGDSPVVLARYQSTLGAALSRRYAAVGRRDDLDQACEVTGAAAASVPDDDPLRASILANAGLALRRRAAHGDAGTATARSDLAAAASAYAAAAGSAFGSPLVRAISAQEHGRLAAELADPPAAVAAFEQAIALLAEVGDEQLTPDDHGHQLMSLAGLGPMAAAAALDDNDDHRRALALLERGRGVLLARLLATRGELDQLAQDRPDLAAEFERIGRERNREPGLLAPGDGDGAARRRRLADEHAAVLRTIRALRPYRRFPLPLDDPHELDAPAAGPVIAVNVAPRRCDALIVIGNDIRHVRLRELDYSDVVANATEFLAAAHDTEGRDRDTRITAVLEWMWDTFAARLLDELGMDGARAPDGDLPRLWWLPSGALAVLPIHAAGYHDRIGMSVLDRAVSSYTPTLRALRAAGVASAPAMATDRPLVVAVPDVEGQRPLPAAGAEADRVARLVHHAPAPASRCGRYPCKCPGGASRQHMGALRLSRCDRSGPAVRQLPHAARRTAEGTRARRAAG